MARTELPNGVILPAEYSDDWYEDMTSNLTKLDDVIGSDSEKLNADGVYFLRMSSAALTDSGTGNFSDLNSSYKIKTGDLVLDSGRKLYRIVSVDSTNETFTVGNSLFKVTAESDLAHVAESGDYDDLDNKPNLSPYDQHLANTDIHVTTADKTKWNNGVSQAYVLRYSSTAITDNSTIAYSTLDNTDNIKSSDKIIDSDGKIFSIVSVDSDNSTVTVGSALIDLALDANVMHLSGNETASGEKTFSDMSSFQGSYLGNEASTNARTDLVLESNRDTHGQSGLYFTKFRQNKAQGAMSGNDIAYLSFDCLENSVRTNHGLRINFLNFVDDIPQRFILWSGITERLLGVPGSPWSDVSTNKINGLNPGALSFPDLSNGLDISGYISNGSGHNEYTPLVDGWISVILKSTSGATAIFLHQGDFVNGFYGSTSLPNETEPCAMAMLPVKGGSLVNIDTKGANSHVYSAKFYPCLGNV